MADPHAQHTDRLEFVAQDGNTADEAERTYGLFNHLVGLASIGELPLVGLIGAAIMWGIKREESEFLDEHGREAVNFQISLLLYLIVGSLVTLGVGIIVLLPALIVLRLVGCIRGAMAAHRGEHYRYPMCIRFIT